MTRVEEYLWWRFRMPSLFPGTSWNAEERLKAERHLVSLWNQLDGLEMHEARTTVIARTLGPAEEGLVDNASQ